MGQQFSLKDLGELSYFLGIEVQRDAGQLVLRQRQFVREPLQRMGMLGAKPTATPMVVSPKLTRDVRQPLSNSATASICKKESPNFSLALPLNLLPANYPDHEPLMAYCSSTYYEANFAPCYVACEPEIVRSNVAYSFTEPNYVEYALNPSGDDYGTIKTRFIVSYSVSEFNEPAFDEYDPTPYGGGYDPVATYGKPLPPSEKICYPRSSPQDPNDQTSNKLSHVSIESPDAKESNLATKAKQQQQSKIRSSKLRAARKMLIKEDYPDVQSNGSEHETRVSQIPPGYGLEAMDLCESLFGHWPCLARAKREDDYYRNRYGPHGVCGKWSDENCPWEEETADYLFGNPYPYGERWSYGGVYEHPMFNYERHYEGQLVSRQMEYQEEHSWLN
ncbi:uncharacterized protein LOC120204050 [Hibiscus syriacus]|uniref:uncharacterized protein LOC120204050 n=1 Tax=Hibiscus syriacus TaxID=106335 RepID=UPI001923E494|nr:uncharacterized protein LOC120204050 [Hibiscus syriacus]